MEAMKEKHDANLIGQVRFRFSWLRLLTFHSSFQLVVAEGVGWSRGQAGEPPA